MTENEVLFLITAIIGLFLFIKFWRFFIWIAVFGSLAAAGIYLYNQSQVNGSRHHYPPPDRFPRPPSQPPGIRDQKPDFVIVGATQHPPGHIIPRERSIYFMVRVSNLGNADYNNYVRVQGPGNADGGFQGLRRGETKSAKIPILVAPNHQLRRVGSIFFRVDPDNIIPEWNENNNEIGPFSVEFY